MGKRKGKWRKGKWDAALFQNQRAASRFRLPKSGIIDPTKVTRSALQNAASVSTLLLTSDALIAEKPKRDDKKGGGGEAEDMY